MKPWNWLEWDTREDTFYGKSYVASIWTEWYAHADAVMADHKLRDAAGDHELATRHSSCGDPNVVKAFTKRSFKSRTDQLTVLLISTVADSSSAGALALVKKYVAMKVVRNVILAWTSDTPVPKLHKKISGKKVKVFRASKNPSIQYIPHSSIDTRHVLCVHQGIALPEASVTFMLRSANESPGRVVSPRVAHSYASTKALEFREATNGRPYDLADASIMLFRTDLLFLYSCTLDLRLLRLVQDERMCHGILMNIVASATSEHPPLHVNVKLAGSSSSDPAKNAKCLAALGAMISPEPVSFQQAFGTAIPFDDTN